MKNKTKKTKIKLKTRTSWSYMGKRFFVGLILLGVVLIGVGVVHRYYYYRSLRLSDDMIALMSTVELNKVVPERILVWDMVDVEIAVAPFISNNWVVYEDRGAYLELSAGIGEEGNMIIYGHNTRDIFSDIRVLKGGEQLRVIGSDGREYIYRVEQVEVVGLNDVQMLTEVEGHALVLYTCTGFMDSQRFVVRAELL